jgi:hypothetical protein
MCARSSSPAPALWQPDPDDDVSGQLHLPVDPVDHRDWQDYGFYSNAPIHGDYTDLVLAALIKGLQAVFGI